MLNIQSDSRKIKKGDTFIALQCEVNDGHAYIEKAIENGASKLLQNMEIILFQHR